MDSDLILVEALMAKQGVLEEYRGAITPTEAAEGINAAKRNARRLVTDARLLFEAGHYPSSAALAALPIEESGKVSIVRTLAVLTEPKQLREEWRRYRDHRSKNGAWILPDLVAAGARRLRDFATTVERDAEHTSMLNAIKQLGLYTDCYRSGHWSEPDNVVNQDLAAHLLQTAEIMSSSTDVTAREIELWVENVGPVHGTSDMALGLMRWAVQMFREGLSDRKPEEYAKFVFGNEAAAEWREEPQTVQ